MVLSRVRTHELTELCHNVKQLIHCRIGEIEKLLQAVDSPHGLEGERRASAVGALCRCARGDQGEQFAPEHRQSHLVK